MKANAFYCDFDGPRCEEQCQTCINNEQDYKSHLRSPEHGPASRTALPEGLAIERLRDLVALVRETYGATNDPRFVAARDFLAVSTLAGSQEKR